MNVSPEEEIAGRSAPWLDRRSARAAAAASLLMFAPLFLPMLGGRFFALDDLSAFHVPLRYIFQRALTSGDSILWTSQLFSGFYVHAEGQIGAFHPLHLVLYGVLPLTIAFNLELIASYAFGFAGMWRFLTRRGFTTASGLIGGLAFAFSGFALLHLPHMNAVAVVAHIPWLLLSIDLGLSDAPATRRRGLIAISLIVASQVLLGYPQYVWMSALTAALYGVICGGGAWRRLMLGGGAAISGLMLGGVQLVPSMALLQTSVRETAGTDFAVSFSLHPLNILQLFSPYLLLNRVFAAPNERIIHELGIYSGALATVALAWAFVRRRQLPNPNLALFAVVTTVVGLVLALGRYGFVYEWVAMMPLVGKFRAPARHILLVHLGFSILIAMLFEDVRRLCVRKHLTPAAGLPVWLWIPVVASVWTAVVAMWRPELWAAFPDQPMFVGGMLVGTLFLGATTLMVMDAARGSRTALLALPVVLAIDLGVWGYSYVFAGGTRTIAELAALAAPPPSAPGTTVHQPARVRQLNALLLHDLRVLRPYVGLLPHRALTLSSTNELRVSGVEWLATEDGWTRVADPMPRIRFVADWRVSETPSALDGIDIRQTALVGEPLPASASPDARATLVVDSPGLLRVAVSTSATALLVTTEAYDRGWRATGPSGAMQTTPVYGDYLGVVVEPGDYELNVSFAPDSIRTGAAVSASGLMLLGLIALLGPAAADRSDHRPPSD